MRARQSIKRPKAWWYQTRAMNPARMDGPIAVGESAGPPLRVWSLRLHAWVGGWYLRGSRVDESLYEVPHSSGLLPVALGPDFAEAPCPPVQGQAQAQRPDGCLRGWVRTRMCARSFALKLLPSAAISRSFAGSQPTDTSSFDVDEEGGGGMERAGGAPAGKRASPCRLPPPACPSSRRTAQREVRSSGAGWEKCHGHRTARAAGVPIAHRRSVYVARRCEPWHTAVGWSSWDGRGWRAGVVGYATRPCGRDHEEIISLRSWARVVAQALPLGEWLTVNADLSPWGWTARVGSIRTRPRA